MQAAWYPLAAALALVAAVDAIAALQLVAPEVLRHVPATLALGVPVEVALRAANGARGTLRLELFDHHPDSFEAEGLPQSLSLKPGEWRELRYQVRPLQRGEMRFGATELRLASPLGLWGLHRRAGSDTPVRVYPNFRALARYTLLATDNRLSQIGVLQVRRRRRGHGIHSA